MFRIQERYHEWRWRRVETNLTRSLEKSPPSDWEFIRVAGFFMGSERGDGRVALKGVEHYIHNLIMLRANRGLSTNVLGFGEGLRASLSIVVNRTPEKIRKECRFVATQHKKGYLRVLLREAERRLVQSGGSWDAHYRLERMRPPGAPDYLLKQVQPIVSREILTEIQDASPWIQDMGGVTSQSISDVFDRGQFHIIHECIGGICYDWNRDLALERVGSLLAGGGVLVSTTRTDTVPNGFEMFSLPREMDANKHYRVMQNTL